MIDFTTERIGTITPNRPGIEPVELFRGMSQDSVTQLVHFSRTDEAVRSQTSDGRRFDGEEAVGEWQKKGQGRFSYTLLNRQGRLAGFIWFGPDAMPAMETISPDIDPREYGFTFAIRTYEEARGKGLAVPFMRLSFDDIQEQPIYVHDPVKNFWLETSQTNTPAVKAYENFGFEHATTRPDEHGRILMVYKPS